MANRLTSRGLVWVYATTIFVSAFLLFQVQPIISKFILPWFGGTPAVWTTCMVFFQSVLFAGYLYAHLSQTFLKPWAQALVHAALICAALLMLPIQPSSEWKPTAGEAPTFHILLLLGATVGLPYFVLSSTGPLLQAWFSKACPGRSPYRLYALSNLGSLLALLSFPFYVEPRFALASQVTFWSLGFVVFGVICAWGAMAAWRASNRQSECSTAATTDTAATAPPERGHVLLWLALPALASLMLLATTNHVCQDVAVIPFLWVLPLSLYLLSFIICFDHPRWYWRRTYATAAIITLGIVTAIDQLIATGSGIAFSFTTEITLHFAALFFLCMVCHGELVRLRPNPKYLTMFYLMISAGGAAGGMFVSLVAPAAFSTFFEWKLGLVAGCLVAALVVLSAQPGFQLKPRYYFAAPVFALLFLGMNSASKLRDGEDGVPLHARSFYGVVSVAERDKGNPERHRKDFYSGRIIHGVQFQSPEKRDLPTAYFGKQAGAGRILTAMEDRGPLRVGVIGLGIGTLASYARPGDEFRFYEINPEVVRVANDQFTYLKDCKGHVTTAVGDGRLSLEQESGQYDLLMLDAFSGDSVPTHLLTTEAFDIYLKHLAPEGAIAVNVSNRYLNLIPIVTAVARHFGLESLHFSSVGNPKLGTMPAEWMLLTRNTQLLDKLRPQAVVEAPGKELAPWTDDHADLFSILK